MALKLSTADTLISMEAVQQTFNGSVSSNGRVTTTSPAMSDLVGRMYLEHTIDATASDHQ